MKKISQRKKKPLTRSESKSSTSSIEKVQPVSLPSTEVQKPVNEVSKQKIKHKESYVPLFIITVFTGIGINFINSLPVNNQIRTPLLLIFCTLFLLFIFVLFIGFVKALPKMIMTTFMFSKKRPLIALVLFFGIVLTIFGSIKIYNRSEYWRNKNDLELLQNILVQAVVTKSIGDSIIAKQYTPEGWNTDKVKKEAITMTDDLDKINTPAMYRDYAASISTWLDEIKTSTKDAKSWETVSDMPGDFYVTLDNWQIEDTLRDSIETIVGLKEFGDNAISRKDRDSMRYIAARLAVEQHWLTNLGYADQPNIFAYTSDVQAKVGYAIVRTTTTRRPCVGKNRKLCLNDVKNRISGVYRSALGYSVGEPSAEQDWDDSWKESAPAFEEGGYYLGGAGIQQGEPNGVKLSPRVQAFYDECEGRGGTVGRSGVKTRLPVGEDGYTCRYGDNGGCWDFLTYSNRRFKGGESGCPEQGLIPVVRPNIFETILDSIQDIIPEPTVYEWDGTYTVETTGGKCNVPYLDYMAFSPYSYQIVVRHNQIVTEGYGNISIDKNGKATMSFSFADSGVSGSYKDTMTFTKDGKVSGGFTFTGGGASFGVAVTITCQGTYTGRK